MQAQRALAGIIRIRALRAANPAATAHPQIAALCDLAERCYVTALAAALRWGV